MHHIYLLFFHSGASGGDVFLHQFAGNMTTSMCFHFSLSNIPHHGGWNDSGLKLLSLAQIVLLMEPY